MADIAEFNVITSFLRTKRKNLLPKLLNKPLCGLIIIQGQNLFPVEILFWCLLKNRQDTSMTPVLYARKSRGCVILIEDARPLHFQGQEELRSLDAGEEVHRSLSARQTGRGLSQVSTNVRKTLLKK